MASTKKPIRRNGKRLDAEPEKSGGGLLRIVLPLGGLLIIVFIVISLMDGEPENVGEISDHRPVVPGMAKPDEKKDNQTTSYSVSTTNLDTDENSGATSVISPGSLATEEITDSSVVTTIDIEATNREIEKQLNEEIERMREQYHSNREGLMRDAVSFLRGNHSERGVKSKAANFRKLADKLRQDIEDFPKASSDGEAKLWAAQIEELEKSASYCNQLADRISATQASERKMKIAASQLESQGAP